MEPPRAARRQAVPEVLPAPRGRRRSCRCCTRACSRTSRTSRRHRADLVAILLTGMPNGIVPGFQNYTGHDVRRHAAAQPRHPAGGASRTRWASSAATSPDSPTGAGSIDDVVTIELRAIAGVTYPLVAPTYKPDGAASLVTDGSAAPGFLSVVPVPRTPRTTASPQSHDQQRARGGGAHAPPPARALDQEPHSTLHGPGHRHTATVAPSSSTSVVTSVRWCWSPRRRWSARRSTSARTASPTADVT